MLIQKRDWKNRDHLNDYQREWRNKNRDKALRIQKKSLEKLRVKTLQKISNGPSCYVCGTTDLRVLCVDHIHNDGCKDSLRSAHLWRLIYHDLSILEAKNRFQVLCRNCNWIKHIENSKYPELIISSIEQLKDA